VAIEQLSKGGFSQIFRRNANRCSSCEKKNLPEPIAFAQLSRLTSEYVCGQCYSDHNLVIRLKQTQAGRPAVGG